MSCVKHEGFKFRPVPDNTGRIYRSVCCPTPVPTISVASRGRRGLRGAVTASHGAVASAGPWRPRTEPQWPRVISRGAMAASCGLARAAGASCGHRGLTRPQRARRGSTGLACPRATSAGLAWVRIATLPQGYDCRELWGN